MTMAQGKLFDPMLNTTNNVAWIQRLESEVHHAWKGHMRAQGRSVLGDERDTMGTFRKTAFTPFGYIERSGLAEAGARSLQHQQQPSGRAPTRSASTSASFRSLVDEGCLVRPKEPSAFGSTSRRSRRSDPSRRRAASAPRAAEMPPGAAAEPRQSRRERLEGMLAKAKGGAGAGAAAAPPTS